MRAVALALILAFVPGCLAAAVAGGAYIIGKGNPVRRLSLAIGHSSTLHNSYR